jgi:hypothetical protein
MPSTGSINGGARFPHHAPPRNQGPSDRTADDVRHQRNETRQRVIASLLMCPGARTSGRPNGASHL